MDTLPVILYFGCVSFVSLVYFGLKFFKRFRSKNQDDDNRKKIPKQDNQILTTTSRSKNIWFWNIVSKFKLKNKMNEYFPAKEEEKLWGLTEPAGNHLDLRRLRNLHYKKSLNGSINESSKTDLSNDTKEEIISLMSHGRKSRSHLLRREDSFDEEGSLTRVVITEIEQHRNQQNKEIEDYKKRKALEQEQEDKKKHQEEEKKEKSINGDRLETVSDQGSPNAITSINNETRNTNNDNNNNNVNEKMQLINSKLNVALNYLEDDGEDDDSDPIYDVPSSRSLINLIEVSEINLPKKQHGGGENSEISYYHTSSPNLLSLSSSTIQNRSLRAIVGNGEDDDEESIYDTPKSRSFVV